MAFKKRAIKSANYISWIKGVSIGASFVIARIGSITLGVFVSSLAEGTVYNTLQMYQDTFTTPQYRTLGGFKALTDGYYGNYIYNW